MQSPFEISFEFFPPHTEEGLPALVEVVKQLAVMRPEFCSVTYGAGGSTQERTLTAVKFLREQTGLDIVPHISCAGSSKASISDLVQRYHQAGVNKLVVLRGDLPSGVVGRIGHFTYADKLVAFLREQTGPTFKIFVAGYPEMHPEAKDAESDLRYFQQKVAMGADAAITQYFFNVDAYCDWQERCAKAGVKVPLIPGIMPITQLAGLKRFSAICGAEIPRWLYQRLDAFGDNQQALQAFGVEVVTKLCEKLIAAGAPGLHFYTLNKSEATLQICRNLLGK